MTVATKSRRSLHIEKCDFNELILNKVFYLVLFSCINYRLTAKYTFGKLIAKLTISIFQTGKAPKNIALLFET